MIKTDCNAVRSAMTKKNIIPRIGRWWLKLSEYDFEIKHTLGLENRHADALSRNAIDLPDNTTTVADVCVFHSCLDSIDWITVLARTNIKIIAIVEALQKDKELTKDDLRIRAEFKIENGRVFKTENQVDLLYIPDNGRYKIVQICIRNSVTLESTKLLPKLRRNTGSLDFEIT